MTPFAEGIVNELRPLPTHRLTAIVEMARLEAAARQHVIERYAGWPLLPQPEFAHLRDVGPWLFAASSESCLQGQYDFHCDLTECTSDAICGWLISALPPPDLAEHLSQATVAQGPDGAAYLLRFHTELAFPVLHARRDLPGIADWLAPIRSWWVVSPHPERKAWRHFAGYDKPSLRGVSTIELDASCWKALAGDPLSYRLAGQLLEPLTRSGMHENCHGTRLGLVRELLAQAHHLGLSRQSDKIDYVTLMALQGKSLQGSPIWNEALQEARDQGRPLAQALQLRMRKKGA
ncbi:DUF4123 domain-containing protein [Pseudomonas sp. QD4]|uniref:DUF4123 domain-containing protein n=1 Tax=Pseudomonas sp. QD4 TaxID=3368618 RepID=UPI003BA22F89